MPLTLEAPTKDEFVFDGWFLDGEFENKLVDGIIDEVGNVTLYAKWGEIIPEPKSFTVSFDTDGGSDVLSVAVLDGETFDKPDDPTKNGFTFEGWYKESALTSLWVFETDTVTANITLYAKWEEA